MNHLFIINPAAGKNNDIGALRDQIESLMSERELRYEIVVTQAPLHAMEAVRERAARMEPLRVYACGGDGTLNEAVNGAAGQPHVAVTQYPIGSGNDFIKIFGDGRERFFQLENLLDCELTGFDLIRCNDRYAINVCSLGFDARIGTDIARYKKIPLVKGVGAYILSVIANVIKGISEHYIIAIDGEIFDGDFSLVCICNGRWYGGAFNPVPEARPDDGILDVLLVKSVSRLTVARLISKYAKGRYREMGDMVTHFRCRNLAVQFDKPTLINLEGEILTAERAVFTVVRGGVNFFYPKGLSWSDIKNEESRELVNK